MPRQDITIRTADGSAPAGLFTPAGAVPECGVIVYMDAFGPRPALLERDFNFPPYAELVAEVAVVREVLNRHAPAERRHARG